MKLTRRSVALMLAGAGGVLLAWPLLAQDQAPNRRDFTIVAKDFQIVLYCPSELHD